MLSMLNFKKTLFRGLSNYLPLKDLVSVFTTDVRNDDLPIIKLVKFKNSIWSSNMLTGKVFDVTFEILSGDESSAKCMEIVEKVEDCLIKNSIRPYKFIIHKIKVLSTQIYRIKSEKIWVGEVNAKFWLESVH